MEPCLGIGLMKTLMAMAIPGCLIINILVRVIQETPQVFMHDLPEVETNYKPGHSCRLLVIL